MNAVNPLNQLKYNKIIRQSYKDKCFQGISNELGSFSQGFNNIKVNYALFFISKDQVPKEKIPTYVRIVCALILWKCKMHRVSLSTGGNLISYPREKSTPVASIKIIKLCCNSVILTQGAKYCTIDLKDFNLLLGLLEYEHVRITLWTMPP